MTEARGAEPVRRRDRRPSPPATPLSEAPVAWWAPAVLPGRWTPLCLALIAALLVAHLAVNALQATMGDFPGRDPAIQFLALNKEMGLPAWTSSVLLVLVAQALWLLADVDRTTHRRRWARQERLLAGLFVYLSVDEATALHEQTIYPLRTALDLGGALFFSWVVLFVPLAAVVAALCLRWVRGLPRVAGRLVVLAGVLYLGGAVGMEMVGSWMFTQGLEGTMRYAGVVALEEGLEMLGALLMLSVVTWLRLPRAQEQPGSAPAAATPVEVTSGTSALRS
ncbi:hypothetical protein [Cellulomonas aerilata]|uniref:Uncharacterized protein n=1 Tax=Cellulomonas aerilata TaxID=515326 RepID=A0A512D8T0_9CELL|nr:hypothetical protein [Cellulomonas aerilata]GEO32680.1 hypothetical protein CAE01nite_04050 [Cellulomonas aerilata]